MLLWFSFVICIWRNVIISMHSALKVHIENHRKLPCNSREKLWIKFYISFFRIVYSTKNMYRTNSKNKHRNLVNRWNFLWGSFSGLLSLFLFSFCALLEILRYVFLFYLIVYSYSLIIKSQNYFLNNLSYIMIVSTQIFV